MGPSESSHVRSKYPSKSQSEMIMRKAACTSNMGSSPHPVQVSEGWSNFSELFLIHVRLADSLNRFVSLRIKTAFCSNPHNKHFLSHIILVFITVEVVFFNVSISSIPKPEILLSVLESLARDFSITFFSHLSRTSAACNWRIRS